MIGAAFLLVLALPAAGERPVAASPPGGAAAPEVSSAPAVTHWSIAGTLAEACTCRYPCTCQFGEGPTPGPGCRSINTFAIESGKYGGVALDGTGIAVVFGDKGNVIYVDAAASAAQKEGLKAIGAEIARKSGFRVAAVSEAPIGQVRTPGTTSASLGDAGGFEADMAIGLDGKSPVVVENNLDVNVARLEKGKTKHLRYRDALGNAMDGAGTNSSRGRFEWSDATPEYFREPPERRIPAPLGTGRPRFDRPPDAG